jgi:hypothetical protein
VGDPFAAVFCFAFAELPLEVLHEFRVFDDLIEGGVAPIDGLWDVFGDDGPYVTLVAELADEHLGCLSDRCGGCRVLLRCGDEYVVGAVDDDVTVGAVHACEDGACLCLVGVHRVRREDVDDDVFQVLLISEGCLECFDAHLEVSFGEDNDEYDEEDGSAEGFKRH